MGDRGSGKEISPPSDTKETDQEVREIQEQSPPRPIATVHPELGSELPQGDQGRNEAERVEDGEGTEPGEEEQKAPPASEFRDPSRSRGPADPGQSPCPRRTTEPRER